VQNGTTAEPTTTIRTPPIEHVEQQILPIEVPHEDSIIGKILAGMYDAVF